MAINGLDGLDCFGEPEQPAQLPVAYPEVVCNGICLTPADIGLPEYGGAGVVAYAHPDCPEHGDPLDDEADPTYADAPFDDPLDV